MTATIILTSQGLPGGSLEFTTDDLPVSLGRSHRADITIGDPLLSRIHSRIEAGRVAPFAIVDNDSTNLTIVNQHDVDRTDLNDGDVILLGDTEIRVQIRLPPGTELPQSRLSDQTTRELPMRPKRPDC